MWFFVPGITCHGIVHRPCAISHSVGDYIALSWASWMLCRGATSPNTTRHSTRVLLRLHRNLRRRSGHALATSAALHGPKRVVRASTLGGMDGLYTSNCPEGSTFHCNHMCRRVCLIESLYFLPSIHWDAKSFVFSREKNCSSLFYIWTNILLNSNIGMILGLGYKILIQTPSALLISSLVATHVLRSSCLWFVTLLLWNKLLLNPQKKV